MTDADYIKGFRDNDDRVIGQFYKKSRQVFFAYFKKAYSKDEAYITELFQDSCIELWRNVQNGRLTVQGLTCALETYLFSIGRHLMMSRDRKASKCTEYQESIEGKDMSANDQEEASSRSELLDFVVRMVNSMKSPCRKLLGAQYWDRLSGAEIAKKLGYNSADSVKAQKFKCMRKLREMVEKFKKL